MKVGIIGAGTISATHIESYMKCGVHVVAISDRREESAKERAEKYGIKKVYTDNAALLADGEIDAVSIVTPVSSHADIVIEALRAGKHVFCEKPPAMNAEEVERMIAARDEAGKILQFGFVCRYFDGVKRLRTAIAEGRLGKLLFAEAGRLARNENPGGWFTDLRFTKGGMFFDSAIHEIDQLFYILGYPKIKSVRAAVDYENRDLAERLGMEEQGYVSASRGSYNNDADTSVTAIAITEAGLPIVLRAACATGTVEEGPYVKVTGASGGGNLVGWSRALKYLELTDKGFCEEEVKNTTAAFAEQLRVFAECVDGGKPTPAPAEEALALMRFFDAVYLSGKTGEEILL